MESNLIFIYKNGNELVLIMANVTCQIITTLKSKETLHETLLKPGAHTHSKEWRIAHQTNKLSFFVFCERTLSLQEYLGCPDGSHLEEWLAAKHGYSANHKKKPWQPRRCRAFFLDEEELVIKLGSPYSNKKGGSSASNLPCVWVALEQCTTVDAKQSTHIFLTIKENKKNTHLQGDNFILIPNFQVRDSTRKATHSTSKFIVVYFDRKIS